MKLASAATILGLLPWMALANWPVKPPSDADPDTVADCTYWKVAADSDTCEGIAKDAALTLAEFKSYNPSLGGPCKMVSGNSYCTERNYGIPTPSPTTTPAPTTTPPGNGISTPTPIQDGMTKDCDKFYLVKKGDSCDAIASNHGISLSKLNAWNPALEGDCSGLWAKTYVCVSIIGEEPTPSHSPPPTTTKPDNGIKTPTPTQDGMVNNCDEFYLVKKGDQCAGIAKSHNISTKTFYYWNPDIGDGCKNLWADVYVCVHTIGFVPSTTVHPTSTGNGIATPTPIQTGMTKKCDRFLKVKEGHNCDKIAKYAKVTVDTFVKWNPSVGKKCDALWLGYYVCISLI